MARSVRCCTFSDAFLQGPSRSRCTDTAWFSRVKRKRKRKRKRKKKGEKRRKRKRKTYCRKERSKSGRGKTFSPTFAYTRATFTSVSWRINARNLLYSRSRSLSLFLSLSSPPPLHFPMRRNKCTLERIYFMYKKAASSTERTLAEQP